jgi:uncharacterized protein (TIGR02117 family)
MHFAHRNRSADRRLVRRPVFWRSTVAAGFCLFALLAARSVLPAGLVAPPAPRSYSLYVIAGGWHTELALPLVSINPPLTTLMGRFPGAKYLVFGWGARGFYMEPHPDFADLMRAAAPGPAVMLVIPLAISPAAFAGPANTIGVAVSPAGAARLSQLLWGDLLPDRVPRPRELGPGPEPGSAFFAATGTYDLSHTCNTWTAEALRAAGVPVSAEGVVFADQLLDQLRERR